MAITQSQQGPGVITQIATGKFTDTAGSPALMTITPGFNPRYIRVLNFTTRVEHEWRDGMGATESLKTLAAGTRSLDTNSAILIVPATAIKANSDDPTQPTVAVSFTFFAAGIAQNDVLYWEARA